MGHVQRLCLALALVWSTHGAAAAADERGAAAAPRPLPIAGETPLLPGRYATSRFQPTFTFNVSGHAWRIEHDRVKDLVLMTGSPCCGLNANDRTGVLAFLRPSAVYSPDGRLLGVPADLASWLRRNAHLRSSRPSRVVAGGIAGTQLDVSFASATVLGGCAHLLRVSFGVVRLCRGERARVVVLKVKGKQLLIFGQATPASGTDSLRSSFRRVLRTVRFGAARAGRRGRSLVLGSSNPSSDDELFFAREAARRSGGTLEISLRSNLYGEAATNEQNVVRDLVAGRLDLAWNPTRVWDLEGVTSLRALQAPFLVDSFPLLAKVITGPLGDDLLSGSRAKGVVGLGLAAENLRRPLGAKKALASLDDFRGARINVIASELSNATMRALGARPMSVGGGRLLRDALAAGRVDAAETAIEAVYSNTYAGVAKYMTRNVVFYPKVIAIDANQAAFDGLTPGQRTVLGEAAQATAARSTAAAAARERADAAALCRAGVKFARATPAELAALVHAVDPVYEALARDRLTARLVAGIQALKQRIAPGAGVALPASCST
jgi:TRAP-type C4-dicarboxylate transport system substrate-binding protein